MGEFSITHILIVAVVVLVFFGPKRLPEFGKSLGDAIKGFKKAMSNDEPDQMKNQNNTQISQQNENSKVKTAQKEEDKV